MADDLYQEPLEGEPSAGINPDYRPPAPAAPRMVSEGIALSDVPQSEFDPIEVSSIETIQGPALQEREAAQSQVAGEQMTAIGIEEAPPEPPPGIDRFLFNEIAPPSAEMLPEVHDLRAPTEQEARKAMNLIGPGASEEEVARSQATVARYLENKRDDERAEQIEFAQQYYTDENKRKQLAQHPDMKRATELSPDPELVEQTSINNAWLNANAGRKLSAPELDIARQTVGKQLFNIPKISNQQFFTKMQEWSKGQAAERDVALKLDAAVGAHVLQDQLTRTYTPDYQVLEQLKKEHPDVFTPENERKFTLMNQRMHGRMRQLGDQVLEPYSQIFTLVQKAGKGEVTDEDWAGIVDSLRAIDPEDRQRVWGMVGRAGRAGIIDSKGLAQFMENMSKGWAREFNLSDRTERDRETQIDDMRRQMDAGAKFGSKDGRLVYAPPGQPLTAGATELTPEGYADYREKLNRAFDTIALVREAQEAYETIVDPIRPIFKEGLLSAGERGLYSLPAMGKLMIGGVIPGFGPILTFDAIQADIYRRTRLENPDMPVPEAARMATVSSALQTIPEQIQIGLPLGKFGKLLEVDRDLTKTGFWAGATVLAKGTAKGVGAEFMMENFQDTVDMFYPAIKSQFDPTMKRQDLGEVAWQWLNTRPEVFAAVLVPGSVAAGVHTYHDLKNPVRHLFNSDVLRGLGIREEGIQRILGLGTFEEMQAQLRIEDANVTPEDRARGHDYISATAAATAAKQAGVASPSYRVVTQNDGTKVYEVLDETGKVVYSNTDEDLAQAAYTDTVTAFTTQQIAAQAAAQETEEGVVAGTEAEGTVRLLDEPSRTSASVMLDFTPNERPTPELAGSLARLERALAKDPRSGGEPVRLVPQSAVVDGATPAGQRLIAGIRGFERLFGKNVVFVRSGSDAPLPFTGVVISSDPNTIFLDADGDRNVLALLGHEWAHTLKESNPTLYKTMVAQMRPLVVDWMRQEKLLSEAEGYPEAQVTDELVGNIIGDSFTRPDFWAALHVRNPSLFEQMVRAFEKWWNDLMETIRGSEWATEEFISDLTAMHNVIADAIAEAQRAGPETVPRGTEEALFATRRADEEHRMKIQREERKLAEKTRYTGAERTMLEGKLAKLLDAKGLTGSERKATERDYRKQIEDQVRGARAKFSTSDKWMAIEPKGVEIQLDKGKEGEPDVEKAVVTWEKEAYTFDKGTDPAKIARKVVEAVKEIAAKALDPSAEGHENAVTQMRQRGWYRNMTLRLRQEFGGFADLFADLLGATSPNTGVDQNWKFSIIALRAVTRGDYDKELATFDAWLKAGKSVNDYKDSGQPLIVQPNGKLFGMNSDKAMKAMLDLWRLIKAGNAPKARNFALNLIGQSNKATIDVWAARFLQRMAGHPRVPNLAEKAVAGLHLTDPSKVGGAFGFGQNVFAQATEILRAEMPEEFAEMNPPDLQALVWFAEKELWATKDWTSTIGEGGSFEAMADLERVQRYVAGLSQERPHSIPTTAEQLMTSYDLNGKLAAMGQVIASRVKDTYGMFMGSPERSFDVEVLAGPGFDPWPMVREVAASAARHNQDSTFISRLIPAGEINGNARPGLEIYFRDDVGPAALKPIMDFLQAREVDGFTLVVDPRAEEDVVKPVQLRGIRFQYIPEFAQDGDQWAAKAAEKEQILREAIDILMAQEGVAFVGLVQYDTLVLTRDDYGNQIDERDLSGTDVGGSRTRVWIERARDAQYSRATSGGEGGGTVSAPAISERGEVAPGEGTGARGPPGLEPAAPEAGAGEAGGEGGGLSFATRRTEVEIPPRIEAAYQDWKRVKEEVDQWFARNPEPERGPRGSSFENPMTSGMRAAAEIRWRTREDWEQAAKQQQKRLESAEEDAMDRMRRQLGRKKAYSPEQAYRKIVAGLQFATRRGKFAQAKVEGANREESVAAAFEKLHGQPEKRLQLFQKIKGAFEQVRARHQAAEARLPEDKLAETQRLHAFAELNAILKALPPEIRGRITPVVSLAQVRATEAGLADFLTKALRKVDVAIEAALKQEYTTRITALLERSEPKKTPGGVLKSPLGPEAERATSIARKAVKMDNNETSTRLATIDAALQSPEITEEEQANLVEEWTILNSFGDLDNRNAESLASAHAWLAKIVVTGRSEWRQREQTRAARMQGIRDQIIKGLGRGTRAGLGQKEMSEGGLAMLSSYGLSHSNFLQFLARILPESPFLKDWMARTRRADNASQDAALAAGDRLMAHMRSTLGIDSRGGLAQMMWRLKEPVKGAVEAYDGRVIDKDGNVTNPGTLEKLDMSRLEAIQFLLGWAQPDVQAKMIAQGWTPDSIAQMEKMTSNPESQAVLAFLRAEFAASYAISNPIYEALFGMSMPQVKNYAPTRFRATKDAGDIAPFGGPNAASGLTPSYAKSRVNHSAMMDQVDALNVYWQHIAQQAHWTAFAELTRELRSVLGNRDVRASIEQAHGKKTLQQVDLWIDTIANAGGNKAADIIVNARILDVLISGKAMSTLGFSLRTIFAQVDSMMRAVFALPMGRIAKAIADPKFFANIPKAWHSDSIQRRVKNGGSPEARYLFEQTRLKPSIMLRMGRASMMPIQLTDAGLTSLSSAVVFTDSYNQAIKAGHNEAEATAIAADDMDDAIYRYSQPTGIGSRSLQELTGGQWKKAFMLFMSDARLKTALYFEAGTNIVKGKGTALDWQRVIFVHTAALISQIVLNAYRDTFSDDDDDEIWTAESLWKAVLLGPLQGLVLLGSAADAVASKMIGGQYFAPSRDPMLDAIANGGRALQNLDQAWNWEDRQAMLKEWNAIARAIAVHPVLAAPAVMINFLKPIFGLWANLEKEE